MSTFTWRYEGADGAAIQPPGLPTAGFPNQADAESWVGEAWRDLLAAGVDQVTLVRDDAVVYGPMSLRPLE
jgi:hypothetical protein